MIRASQDAGATQVGSLPRTATSISDDDMLEKDLEKAEEAVGERPEDAQADPNLVVWNGPDDPDNPMNWPVRKKWIITVALGLITLCVTFASSTFSTATVATSIEFSVSTEVTTLGTSLFVLGYAFGPLVSRISRLALVRQLLILVIRYGVPAPRSLVENCHCSLALPFLLSSKFQSPLLEI